MVVVAGRPPPRVQARDDRDKTTGDEEARAAPTEQPGRAWCR